MLAAVALAASVLVLVAVVTSRSGTTEKVSDADRVALFDGIPQSGEWLGAPDAPVVVEEYADLQCPFCADFATRGLPPIVRDFVRPGDVRMRLRLLAFLGPDSVEGARAAVGAMEQNRGWDFTEAFYARQGEENSGYVTDDFLREVAGDVRGLDVDRALAATGGGRAAARRQRPHGGRGRRRRLDAVLPRRAARRAHAHRDRRRAPGRHQRGAPAVSAATAVSIALALAGVAVAGYLTYVHFAGLEPVCAGGGGGCERVQASDQSRLARDPRRAARPPRLRSSWSPPAPPAASSPAWSPRPPRSPASASAPT